MEVFKVKWPRIGRELGREGRRLRTRAESTLPENNAASAFAQAPTGGKAAKISTDRLPACTDLRLPLRCSSPALASAR